MRRLLIVYGTSYGQTAKIASRMRDVLQSRGYDVALLEAGNLPDGLDPRAFDGVIVGASVIATGHQRAVTRFVRRHLAALNAMPSAFFSVSASAGSANQKGRDDAARILNQYLAELTWIPSRSASIAGAINYMRYGWFLRWFMKRAAAANGGSIDTSRDHELTDWAQVDAFANGFAALIERATVAV